MPARPAECYTTQQLVGGRNIESLAHRPGPGAERPLGAGAQSARLCRQHQRLQENAGIKYGVGAQFLSHENEEDHRRTEEFEIAPHLAIACRAVFAGNAE